MKRTSVMKVMTIGLVTVSAFALSACQDETSTASTFKDVNQCVSAAKSVDATFTEADCKSGFTAAQAENASTAPRYDAMAVCEEQHGPAACVAEQRADGSSVFMPMMMGYMVGSMLNNNSSDRDRRYSHSYAPMYPVSGGGYSTATGVYSSSLNSKGYVSPAALVAKPSSTVNAAPMTKATAASRGGFGGRSSGMGG